MSKHRVIWKENSNTNTKTVTFENSLYSTYDFDDANRLQSITDNTNGVYSFAYDNLNRMTTRVMPNGVSTTTDYDGMGRMKFFKNTNASSNVLSEFVYSYNTANQITQITEPTVRTRTFGYDNADRLTSSTSTVSGQNESYTFDDVGNRISSHLSSVYGYQSGSFNRLSSTQQASYSFDNNGNLTSKTEGTAKWYYSYDRENRLMNAAKFGGMMPRANESVNYQYDALGRRVVRQDKKTGRIEFTHDGMDVIQDRFEKNDGSTSTTNYVNGLGIDDKLKLTNGSTSRYFLTDHLGSTVGMSDTNGNVTESASYDSFGRTISSNLTTRYQYTGREADSTTGLMYYRARFYDPQIGRFTSEDPIGFAGGDINLYGYVWNNPQHFTDPTGNDGFPTVTPKRKTRGKGHRPKPRGTIEPPPTIEEPPPSEPPIIDPPPPISTATPVSTPMPPTPFSPPPSTPPSSGDCDCQTAIPRMPDYYTISVSLPVYIPQVGGSFSISMDRNYHFYAALGVGGGAPSFMGANLTAGWMLTRCKPTKDQLQNYLTGFSVHGGGFAPPPTPFGGFVTWSPGNGAGVNLGVGTPGGFGGASYGFPIW